jgi:hypothetical protein
VTCSFICAPSEKPVAKVPCNRVFNQTIADEFNRSRRRRISFVCGAGRSARFFAIEKR